MNFFRKYYFGGVGKELIQFSDADQTGIQHFDISLAEEIG